MPTLQEKFRKSDVETKNHQDKLMFKYVKGDLGKSKVIYGVNWCKSEYSDFEIKIKIPIFPWFKKKYVDFETKSIQSGWFIQCCYLYFRKRSDFLLKKLEKPYFLKDCYIIDKPFFQFSKIGKHKTIKTYKECICNGEI